MIAGLIRTNRREPRARGSRQALRRFLMALAAVLLVCLTGGGAAAGDISEEFLKELRIMPRLGLGVEYGGFLLNREGFSSAFRYALQIDLLQYRRHILYVEIDNETSVGIPQDAFAFNRMRHFIYLLGYRYDLGDYYLGVMAHHRCYTPFREQGRLEGTAGRTFLNTYVVGLEFLSKGMRLGMKDRGIVFDPEKPFEFLGRFNFQAAVQPVFFKEFVDVNGFLQGRVRLDLLRYCRLIPYVEAGGEVLVRPQTRATPRVEGGVRYHGDRFDFTPYIQYGRSQEWPQPPDSRDLSRFASHPYVLGGARLEWLLEGEKQSQGISDGLSLLPEVHGTAFYAVYLNSRLSASNGGVELDFEALRYHPLTFFVYGDFLMDSRSQDFSPRKVSYLVQYGLSYTVRDYFLEGFVQQGKRLDASEFMGLREKASLAGGRLGTLGMKPGHVNDGITFGGPHTFQWLNLLNASVSLAGYFDTNDWPFLLNLAARGRWDVLRWRFLVPYLEAGLDWLKGAGGHRDAWEFFLEPGVRLHGGLDLIFFGRFQHRETILSAQGPVENQVLGGIKVMF